MELLANIVIWKPNVCSDQLILFEVHVRFFGLRFRFRVQQPATIGGQKRNRTYYLFAGTLRRHLMVVPMDTDIHINDDGAYTYTQSHEWRFKLGTKTKTACS